MSILTYLTEQSVRDGVRTITGKTLGRPRLLMTDGTNLTYAVDVDIAMEAPLRTVPIAAGNYQIVYAEAGAAVTLTRSESGRWEITGFAKRMPGTVTRVPVTVPTFDFGLPEYTIGTPESVGLDVRPLTYDELATLGGGYGVAPYGAIGIFRDGELIEVTI